MKSRAEEFAALAPHLSARPADPHARLNYDLFADALVWSDELPIMPPESEVRTPCLRGLLRYRTTLVLGEPGEKHRPAWEEGLKHFPEWIGFRAERRDPRWAETFRTLRTKVMANWEEFEESFDVKFRAAKPDGPTAAHDQPATNNTL